MLERSLMDYFILRDIYFLGYKRAISYLKDNDVEGYTLFHKAITSRDNASIKEWIEYLI